MAEQRLGQPRYLVNWSARLMTQDRSLHDVSVNQAVAGGVGVIAHQALPLSSAVNIEFHVKYRGNIDRIRAKTKVVYCRILSGNEGVVLELRFTHISNDENHVYNNILQVFASSKEFQLRM